MIRVGAAGINNTDINTRIGWYSKAVTDGTTTMGREQGFNEAEAADGGWAGALDFPRIQGADVCGQIIAVGADVADSRIGKRVLVEPCLHKGRPSFPIWAQSVMVDLPSIPRHLLPIAIGSIAIGLMLNQRVFHALIPRQKIC